MNPTLRTSRASCKKEEYLSVTGVQLSLHKVQVWTAAPRSTTRSHSTRASRARDIMLRRWLTRLRKALAILARPERRVAIERLPPRARAALLDYMETHGHEANGAESPPVSEVCRMDPPITSTIAAVQTNARSLNSTTTHFGCCCPRRRLQVPLEVAVSTEHRISLRRGVRAVPTGLFQASVSFDHLVVRSSTSRSRAGALRHLAVLRRFKELVRSRHGCEEQQIFSAYAEALAEAKLSEEALRPSYCAYVSLGARAGKVESPTTANLKQALAWRRCLLAANSQGLSPLRAVWVEMLQEERTGHSVRLSALAAEARADSLFRRCQNAQTSTSAGPSPGASKRRRKEENVAGPLEKRASKVKQLTCPGALACATSTRKEARAARAQRARDRMIIKAEASVARAAAKISLLTKRPKSPRYSPAAHVSFSMDRSADYLHPIAIGGPGP